MTMTMTHQIKLAETPQGRVALHLTCLLRDHHFMYHCKGIIREIGKQLWIFGI